MTDLTAWLGPAADELNPDQLDQFHAAAADIARYYPHPDQQPERDAAMSAAVQYLLGDTTAADVARDLVAARLAEARAVAASLGVATAMARADIPKAVAAREAGIDRMTLLRARGER